MIRAKKADLSTYFCGFLFLLGGMSGCLTGSLCSSKTVSDLAAFFFNRCSFDPTYAFFSAELLLAVFALLLSIAAFGIVFIPVLDALLGYSYGIILYSAAYSIHTALQLFLCTISLIPDVLFLLHLTVLCSGVSIHIARTWTSSGARVFDLNGRMRVIWTELNILFTLFVMRSLFLNHLIFRLGGE